MCWGLFLLALGRSFGLTRAQAEAVGCASVLSATHSIVHEQRGPCVQCTRHCEVWGRSPWPGSTCLSLETSLQPKAAAPCAASGASFMINRRKGHCVWRGGGERGGTREDVSSTGPIPASWSPSASWRAGCPPEAGSALPHGSARRGTWA